MMNLAKLQQIYAALDNRQPKKAIKLIDDQLQQLPQDNTLKSLKCLALVRSNPPQFAIKNLLQLRESVLPIIDSIILQNPYPVVNETVINHVCSVLKALGEWERAEKFLERVFPTFTTFNVDVGSLLFLSHARCKNHLKAQQVAVNLSKHASENKMFFYWYVVSMAMRGVFENNATNLKMASKLLQRSVQTIVQDFLQYMKKEYGKAGETNIAVDDGKKKKKKKNKKTAKKEETKEDNQKKLGLAEVMQFYIWMLQEQNAYDQVVEEVLLNDEPYGWLLEPIPYDRKQMLAENAIKTEKYLPLSNAVYANLIEKFDTDEWTWWTGYLDSLFKLIETAPTGDKVVKFQEENLKYYTTAQDAKAFIQQMQKKDNKNRGPYLAMLELNRRLIEKSSDSNEKQNVENLLAEYFVKFGGKTVFFEDVKAFLINLGDNVNSFLGKCRAHAASATNVDNETKCVLNLNIRKMERNIFVQQRAENASLKAEPTLIKDLVSEYLASLALGLNLEKTQNQYGDEFLILATHYLLDSEAELNRDSMISSVILLEFALKRSAYNFQLKCLLIRLYALLQIPIESNDIFLNNYKPCGGTNMSIKHIQWETLSYLVYYDLSRLGQTDKLDHLLSEVLMFFRLEHSLETADLLLLAYKNQTYSKVYEFIRFGSRMDRSFMVHVALMDEILTNLITTHADLEPADISKCIRSQLSNLPANFSETTIQFSRNDDINVLLDFGSATIHDNILVPQPALPTSKSENTEIWEKYYFLKSFAHATDLINHLNTKYENVEAFRNDIETWKRYAGENYGTTSLVFELVLAAFENNIETVKRSLEKIVQIVQLNNTNTTDHFNHIEKVVQFIQRDLMVIDIILPQIFAFAKQTNDSAVTILVQSVKKEVQTYCTETVEHKLTELKKVSKSGEIFVAPDSFLQLMDEALAGQNQSSKAAVKDKEWKLISSETLKRMNESSIQTWSRITRTLSDIHLNLNLIK